MSVTKQWVWASSLDGWVDISSGSSHLVLSTTDGNPADCLQFEGTVQLQNAKGRSGSTTDTWETLGVPSGTPVVSVQLSAFDWRQAVSEAFDSITITIDVLDDGGTSVLSGGPLYNHTNSSGATLWASASGATCNVIAGKQASGTAVQIVVTVYASGSTLGSFAWLLDNLTIILGTPVAKSSSDSGSGSDGQAIAANVAGSETGSGSDGGSVAVTQVVSASDSGSGADAVSSIAPHTGDTGNGDDDSGSGGLATLTSADSGFGSDGGTIEIAGTADTWILYSDDDGRTWSTSVATIPNGTKPVITKNDSDGTLIVAAYVSGHIQGRIRGPGDLDFGSLFTFVDDTNTALDVENDTFYLVAPREGPGRWVMAVRILGEAAVSEWTSGDNGRSWTRV